MRRPIPIKYFLNSSKVTVNSAFVSKYVGNTTPLRAANPDKSIDSPAGNNVMCEYEGVIIISHEFVPEHQIAQLK